MGIKYPDRYVPCTSPDDNLSHFADGAGKTLCGDRGGAAVAAGAELTACQKCVHARNTVQKN